MRRLVTSDCGNFKTRYAEEAALFPNDVGRLALGAFLIVWFLVVPAAAGPYLLGVANLTGIAATSMSPTRADARAAESAT